jgi:hypothetical protein
MTERRFYPDTTLSQELVKHWRSNTASVCYRYQLMTQKIQSEVMATEGQE